MYVTLNSVSFRNIAKEGNTIEKILRGGAIYVVQSCLFAIINWQFDSIQGRENLLPAPPKGNHAYTRLNLLRPVP